MSSHESDRYCFSSGVASARPDGLTPEELFDKCNALARNLWWSWQPEVINLFRDLDPIRWRQLDHNPIALLAEFTPERLEMRASELVLFSRINHAFRRLKEYMSGPSVWGKTHVGVLGSKPVAYFSLEFGVHESDSDLFRRLSAFFPAIILRARADWAFRLIAIGLFYDQGYFKQHLDFERLAGQKSISTRRSRTSRWSPLLISKASLSPCKHRYAERTACWRKSG